MLKRGILAEIPDIEGRDFYPLLAEVGKGLKSQRSRAVYAWSCPHASG
jgi:hypothetical protein